MKIYPVNASLVSANTNRCKKRVSLSQELSRENPSFMGKGNVGRKLWQAGELILNLPAIIVAGTIVGATKFIDEITKDDDNNGGNGGDGGNDLPSTDPNSPDYTYPGAPFDTDPYKFG